MAASILAKAASQLISGAVMPALVSAISSATSQYLLSYGIVNSTNNVLGPGAGSQFGRIEGLSPTLMANMMKSKANFQGIAGKDLYKLCSAISFGVVNSLKAVVIQGSVIGGGPGIGTGKITGLVPSALTGFILAQEAFRLLGGSKLSAITSAIAFGICTHIMTTGVVNITNVGAAAPPPAGTVIIPVAPGIGRLC